jgi:prepilin-type N-terminal cleavage/methylation domain-containing protein
MTRVREKFSLLTSEKGFTLIELLIVIVIIGILAGVLIAVIDPAAQQSRARDATVQATINKMALAVGGFRSAYGRAPDALEFTGSIDGETVVVGSCLVDLDECLFTHTSALPMAGHDAACNATNTYVGDGSATDDTNCEYRYLAIEDNATNPGFDNFLIFGKSFGINDGTFVYDSTDSIIHQCKGTDASSGTCP